MSADNSASARKLLVSVSERLRTAATEVVWAQWAAIGTTASGRGRARSIVDPEALVLFSLGPNVSEARVRDLLADWTALHSSLLSVQRIKNLVTAGTKDTHERLGMFARLTVEQGKDFRWRSVAAQATGTAELPPRRTNKVRAVKMPILGPAAIWLKLRLILGVGIKADTLAFLLGIGVPTTARAISAATSYTVAAVGRALDDLVVARLVHVVDVPHQATQYRARVEAWSALLDIDGPLPAWRDWQNRLAFVDDFLAWTDAARDRTVSRYAFGAIARELMRAHQTVFEPELLAAYGAGRVISDTAEHVERSLHEFAARMEAEV